MRFTSEQCNDLCHKLDQLLENDAWILLTRDKVSEQTLIISNTIREQIPDILLANAEKMSNDIKRQLKG